MSPTPAPSGRSCCCSPPPGWPGSASCRAPPRRANHRSPQAGALTPIRACGLVRARMLFRTLGASVIGIESRLVEVEVDSSPAPGNDPRFSTVGLPDAAVRESRERLKAAMRNCGFDLPVANVVINPAPALNGNGAGAGAGENGAARYGIDDYLFVGELALDGSLRPVRGSLPIAM